MAQAGDLSITRGETGNKLKNIISCSTCNKFPMFRLDPNNPQNVIQSCYKCNSNETRPIHEVTEEMLQKEKEIQHKCQNPEHSGDNASKFCVNCEQWLCERCKAVHSQNGHIIKDTNVVSEQCLEHVLPYDSYCTECELNLCKTCADTHEHKNKVKPLAGLLDTKNIIPFQNNRRAIHLHNQQIGLIYKKITDELEQYRKKLQDTYEKTKSINENILELYDIFLGFASTYKKNYNVFHNIKDFCTFSFKKFKYEKADNIEFTKLTVKDLTEFSNYLEKSSLIVQKTNSELEGLQKIFSVDCKNYVSSTAYYKDKSSGSEFIVMGFNDGSIALTDINDPKKKLFEIKEKDAKHKSPVLSLLIDDCYIYSGSVDHVIKKWKIVKKTRNYEILFEGRFNGHQSDVHKLVKIENTNVLISCSSDNQVIFWDTKFADGQKEKKPNKTIKFDSGVISIALMHNKEHLLIATAENNLYLYDINTQQQVYKLDNVICSYPGCLVERDEDIIVGGGNNIFVVKVDGKTLNKIVTVNLLEAKHKDLEFTQDMVNIIPVGNDSILFTNSKNRIYKYCLSDGKVQSKEIVRKGKIENIIQIGDDKLAVGFGKTIEVLSS